MPNITASAATMAPTSIVGIALLAVHATAQSLPTITADSSNIAVSTPGGDLTVSDSAISCPLSHSDVAALHARSSMLALPPLCHPKYNTKQSSQVLSDCI